MTNFLSICTNDGFLSAILFAKRILELVCIFVPIVLILMASIEIGKIVLNPEQKAMKGAVSKLISKMIASVAIFFIPTLVSLLLSLLGRTDFKATDCWINATTERIEAYKVAREAEEEMERQKIAEEKKQAEEERKIVEATREAAREDNEEKAAEAAKNASSNSTGTSTQLAAKLIQVAQNEANSPPTGAPNKYTRGYGALGGSYSYAWCAAFVWWCSNEAGVYPTKVSEKSAGVQAYMEYFKNTSGVRYEVSQAYGGTYVPKMGDYIFFDWEHLVNGGDHIGLVKGVSGDRVLIIDGNYGNTVADRTAYLSSADIIGYGVWE